MGLGLAALTAWWVADLTVYAAIRTDHPLRGWRPDRSTLFGPDEIRREAIARPWPPMPSLLPPLKERLP